MPVRSLHAQQIFDVRGVVRSVTPTPTESAGQGPAGPDLITTRNDHALCIEPQLPDPECLVEPFYVAFRPNVESRSRVPTRRDPSGHHRIPVRVVLVDDLGPSDRRLSEVDRPELVPNPGVRGRELSGGLQGFLG